MKLNLLISQPGFAMRNAAQVYLPYLHSVLKSYANRDPEIKENVNWLDPIFHLDAPEAYVPVLTAQPVDVFGLSCYIWNWSFQLTIAREMKRIHPECLIVIGGPQPDWNDPNFFRQYPFIDVIVKRDGEIPFTAILKKLIHNNRDLTTIPGLVLQQPDGSSLDTGLPQLTTDFNYYPYQECDELFKRVISETEKVTAVFETNRGCPYTCSFCDIGSKELSKIRSVPIERVESETRWFAENKVHTILCADSNLGIMPRDLDIVDSMVEKRATYGYPREFEYDSAKMNLKSNIEIGARLWNGNLITKIKVPWQHLDGDVLKAIERIEPPVEKKAQAAKDVRALGVRCRPELIMGMPGDTPAKLSKAIFEIFEMNFSDALRVNLMLILPNAPAAKTGYRNRWKLKTVKKPVSPLHLNYGLDYNDFVEKSYVEVVVGTSTYDENDWIEMMTIDSFAKVMHSTGCLTKYIAYYLRCSAGVPFAEFYGDLLKNFANSDEFPIVRSAVENLRERRRHYLKTDQTDFYEYPTAQLPFLIGGAEFFYAELMENREIFFDELSRYIFRHYKDRSYLKTLESVLQYQKDVLVTSDYDARKGRSTSIAYDWPNFFKRVFDIRHDLADPVHPVPLSAERSIRFVDSTSNYLLKKPYDWHKHNRAEDKKAQWLTTMVGSWNHWAIEGTRCLSEISEPS